MKLPIIRSYIIHSKYVTAGPVYNTNCHQLNDEELMTMNWSRDRKREPAPYIIHKEANNEYHKLIKESISFVSYSKYIAFNLESLNRHLKRVASKIQVIQSDDSHQYGSLVVDLENVIL